MTTRRTARTHTSTKRGARRKTTRVTVDFPIEEHKLLKARAALEGVTLQEYIRRRILANEDISDELLKPIVKKIIDEHKDVLKRLANK